ncbi:MAG TPA: NADH-quinone oxidoreductase subunit H [Bacteroidales bacterium]|mgnify:FL=1|jgi:formate hydrogenlyase subunit 4|nr:NADH-quinone oxidoreductase subunit H [Bacteroidales bacterium]MBP7035219.1 NADH-quinone oxidoreductase subunit H [Bacteroidales bacterium]HNY56705.1 NADH-quinone oxidoreductase subunit H [Bacteroidales bacterium]HOH13845.1 NADH-quinone oxidoreductase subunit H [Bacteroidales bacterium]HPA68408.1 NADH-quinone oxidoreductase subunit H [Bacteroidales bacterium]
MMAGFILIVVAALFFPGVILRTKSIASGRKGPGIFQPWKDLSLLLRKGTVFSDTTGLIFKIAPSITLATVIGAMLFLPFAQQKALLSFEGDFIMFAYLLALGKFFTIIAALDTGSSFEGMGASREALFSMLVEPAFFILMATFAMFTGYTSFSVIFNHFFITGNDYVLIYSIIGAYLLVQITMIENSRLPVDDPKTHLELTMIHEVMILDYSGFDKALIHIAGYLKFAIYGSLIYNLVVPAGWNVILQIGLFFAVQVLFAGVIGFTESFRARNKMNKNPKFILTLSSIALIAFMVILILTEKLA